jgi:hypothetical protein
MKMRSPSWSASQLGAQEWLMKRAALPPTEASMQPPESSEKSIV